MFGAGVGRALIAHPLFSDAINSMRPIPYFRQRWHTHLAAKSAPGMNRMGTRCSYIFGDETFWTVGADSRYSLPLSGAGPFGRISPLLKEQNMNIGNRPSALLVALAAGTLLMAGCDQRAPAGSTSATPPGSTSAKTDRAADKVGSTVSNAADRTATVAEDAAITAKVKAAILAEPGLKSLQINVDTNGATVTLSGNVDNADLKERAKQIASNTSGVKGVVDQLAVKSS